MNRLMMRRLEALRKRTEWLERRIAQHTGGPPLTYDAAELDALKWALRELDPALAWEPQA